MTDTSPDTSPDTDPATGSDAAANKHATVAALAAALTPLGITTQHNKVHGLAARLSVAETILDSPAMVTVLAEHRAAIVDEVLTHARAVITQYVASAEQWRYDRVCWAFAIMLGEIPADTPEPLSPSDIEERHRVSRTLIQQALDRQTVTEEGTP